MNIQNLKYLILIIFINEISTAQDTLQSVDSKINSAIVISNSYIKSNLRTNTSQNETLVNKYTLEKNIISDYNVRLIENRMLKIKEESKSVKYSFDLISSFDRNINFGGLWNDIAVMNFSPKMYIQPADFINVFASYSISSFIPLAGSEELEIYIKSFALQSISILAIDNFTEYLFDTKSWISSIVKFTLKNLAINLFIKPSLTKKNIQTLPWAEDEYYYYSLNLKF